MKTQGIFSYKQEKVLYGLSMALLGAGFFIILYRPITMMFFETDLIWTFPSLFSISSHNPILKTISIFLFDVYQMNYLDPITNMYYYVVLSLFGPQSKYLVFGGIIINLFIALL